MKKHLFSFLFMLLAVVSASAQIRSVNTDDYNSVGPDGNVTTANQS